MNAKQTANRPSPILMVAPTLLVLIAFYAFLFKSTHRQWAARQSEVARLTEQQPRNRLQIENLQAEIARVNQQLNDADQQRVRLLARQDEAIAMQADLQQRVQFSSAQAGTMNRVMALFAEHQLAIVANESLSGLDRFVEQENQALTDELKLASEIRSPGRSKGRRSADEDLANNKAPTSPVSEASLVSAAKRPQAALQDKAGHGASPKTLQPKRQHTITVQGRFADVRAALRAVLEDFPEVTVTSVELQQIDVRSPLRNWTLSVSL